MIKFAVENFTYVRPEYAAFVHRYWDNSPENATEDPLDFNWDAFIKLDDEKMLHLTVGRDEGRMVCAALYMIMQDLKRKSVKIASCDTFAVARDYRGRGLGAVMFYEAEVRLVELGVKRIYNLYREVYNKTPLFERLGFKLDERLYMKRVG